MLPTLITTTMGILHRHYVTLDAGNTTNDLSPHYRKRKKKTGNIKSVTENEVIMHPRILAISNFSATKILVIMTHSFAFNERWLTRK